MRLVSGIIDFGKAMSCDGSGRVVRDHFSVSGAGWTTSAPCDNKSGCHDSLPIVNFGYGAGEPAVSSRRF
jgi:hypothetical protein